MLSHIPENERMHSYHTQVKQLHKEHPHESFSHGQLSCMPCPQAQIKQQMLLSLIYSSMSSANHGLFRHGTYMTKRCHSGFISELETLLEVARLPVLFSTLKTMHISHLPIRLVVYQWKHCICEDQQHTRKSEAKGEFLHHDCMHSETRAKVLTRHPLTNLLSAKTAVNEQPTHRL